MKRKRDIVASLHVNERKKKKRWKKKVFKMKSTINDFFGFCCSRFNWYIPWPSSAVRKETHSGFFLSTVRKKKKKKSLSLLMLLKSRQYEKYVCFFFPLLTTMSWNRATHPLADWDLHAKIWKIGERVDWHACLANSNTDTDTHTDTHTKPVRY